jgi:hypothetical protein
MYLNEMLLQKGERKHFFSLNPDSWLGVDDEKRLGERVRQANIGSKAKWLGSKSE